MNTELRTLTESEIDFVAGGTTTIAGGLGVAFAGGSHASVHTSSYDYASRYGAGSGASASARGTDAAALSVSAVYIS